MVSNGRRVIEQQWMFIVDHDWYDGDKRKKSRSSEADPDLSTRNRDPWHLCTDSMFAPIVSPFRWRRPFVSTEIYFYSVQLLVHVGHFQTKMYTWQSSMNDANVVQFNE